MADYFAVLDLPRSPWLAPEQVREQFVRFSAQVHPDRVHQDDQTKRDEANQQYAELNAAQTCLSDASARLKHLLELEGVELPKDVGAPPTAITDLFFQIGRTLRSADELLKQKAGNISPMVRAHLMRSSLQMVETIRSTIVDLERREAGLDARCKTLAEAWRQNQRPVDRLTDLLKKYRFLRRWLSQLRERSVQLTI